MVKVFDVPWGMEELILIYPLINSQLCQIFGGVICYGIFEAGFGTIPVGAIQCDLHVVQGKFLCRFRLSDFNLNGFFLAIVKGNAHFV